MDYEFDQPFFSSVDEVELDEDGGLEEGEDNVKVELGSSFSAGGETSFDAAASPTPARAVPGKSISLLSSLPRPSPVSQHRTTHPISKIDPALASLSSDMMQHPEDASIADIAPIEPFDNEPVATAEVIKRREMNNQKVGLTPRGVKLVPITALKGEHQKAFDFPVFNEIQSTIFEDVYKCDDNLVISSPTGSGKTTIFELAFLHQLQNSGPNFAGSRRRLSVYIAPTKALCSEKTSTWTARLGKLGVKCVEITGDTGDSFMVYAALRDADLVVTTPEKLDSMTRRGNKVAAELKERLDLIMIDEVHILREERGATLEVVIARVKMNSSHVRFVAVSATVPNIDDIARWIGVKPNPFELSHSVQYGADGDGLKPVSSVLTMPKAKVFKFGEEFRPVPLQKKVYGIDGGGNEWALGPRLDRELFPLLMRYAKRKPVLVFCPTRKACQNTADVIFKLYEQSRADGGSLPWIHTNTKELGLEDAKLNALSTCGIAVHHAGLSSSDRKRIEDGFRDGSLYMLVSTSTLAVGVNLPAHTVIIKGTMAWHGQPGGFREYSDIEIQQMMGRAGRPQYDTSGTVVIMCDKAKIQKYQSMIRSETILESCLHQNLTEHINSEVGLGTISSVTKAQDWLRNSFLYIRIQQNPKYYALSAVDDKPMGDSWEEWLDHYVKQSINDLESNNFTARGEDRTAPGDYEIVSTATGDIMRNCMVAYPTMRRISEIHDRMALEDLLEVLASAAEFQDLRIRQGEGPSLNKLRLHPMIRFPLSESAKSYSDKVYLVLQATFGNIDLSDSDEAKKTELNSATQTMYAIFQRAPYIAKAIMLVALNREYGATLRAAVELYHTVMGKAWEDSAAIFRQIDFIGPKSMKSLASSGIFTFDDFLEADITQLQLILGRKDPQFIADRKKEIRRLPRFYVSMEEESMGFSGAGQSPTLSVRVTIHLKDENCDIERAKKRSNFKTPYNLAALFHRQDQSFIAYRRLSVQKFKNQKDKSFVIEVELYKRCDKIIAVVGVDELAGASTVVEYETNLADSVYPENMEEETPEPTEELDGQDDTEKLPNGNVPCHHSCRNADTCKHQCCKEGVPPRARQRKVERPSIISAAASKGEDTKNHKEHALASGEPAPAPVAPIPDPYASRRQSQPDKQNEPLFLPRSSDTDNVTKSDDTEEEIDCTVHRTKGAKKKQQARPSLNPPETPKVDKADPHPAEDSKKKSTKVKKVETAHRNRSPSVQKSPLDIESVFQPDPTNFADSDMFELIPNEDSENEELNDAGSVKISSPSTGELTTFDDQNVPQSHVHATDSFDFDMDDLLQSVTVVPDLASSSPYNHFVQHTAREHYPSADDPQPGADQRMSQFEAPFERPWHVSSTGKSTDHFMSRPAKRARISSISPEVKFFHNEPYDDHEPSPIRGDPFMGYIPSSGEVHTAGPSGPYTTDGFDASHASLQQPDFYRTDNGHDYYRQQIGFSQDPSLSSTNTAVDIDDDKDEFNDWLGV